MTLDDSIVWLIVAVKQAGWGDINKEQAKKSLFKHGCPVVALRSYKK